MDVAAFLPPPLLSHLQTVLGRECPVHAASDWAALDALVRRRPVDVAVVDPGADGALRTTEIVELRLRFPSLPVVAYAVLSPTLMRAVVTLARHGVSQVVLHRFDDEPGRFRQLLARQPAEPLGDAVLAQLAPALGRLAPPLAQAVERLFRRPQHFFAAHDLAAAAGMTLRTVYRQLEAAGLASPRLLVVAARVLRGYAYMRDPGREIADVAASLGYSEPRIFTRHTYAAVGLQPRALRRRMEPDAFVRTLADRLLAGEERSPVGAHE